MVSKNVSRGIICKILEPWTFISLARYFKGKRELTDWSVLIIHCLKYWIIITFVSWEYMVRDFLITSICISLNANITTGHFFFYTSRNVKYSAFINSCFHWLIFPIGNNKHRVNTLDWWLFYFSFKLHSIMGMCFVLSLYMQ